MGKMVCGVDIREHGSGNVGATNALRVLGKKLGIACLLLDILKGAVPVIVAGLLLDPTATETPWLLAGVALCTILGHIFTIFLKFKGGKGVASTLGAFLALEPTPVALAVIIGVVAISLTKWVSLGSLLIALGIPGFIALWAAMNDTLGTPGFYAPFGLGAVLCVLIFWSHRSNIKRLLNGTEKRLGEKAGKAPHG
jgi:glycerol-3-phosphate acyltransferase PlsY